MDALTIDGTTLTAASLSNLSGNEFEELVELSSEIELSNEMDSTGIKSFSFLQLNLLK